MWECKLVQIMEYNSLHLETNAGNNKTLNIVYKHIHIGGRILLFFNKFEISLFHDINKALPKTIITVHKICSYTGFTVQSKDQKKNFYWYNKILSSV